MSGNHSTGWPVDMFLDDVESYRWPTEADTRRFEAATCQSCGGSGLKDYGRGVEGCRACDGWGDPDSRPQPITRQPVRTT